MRKPSAGRIQNLQALMTPQALPFSPPPEYDGFHHPPMRKTPINCDYELLLDELDPCSSSPLFFRDRSPRWTLLVFPSHFTPPMRTLARYRFSGMTFLLPLFDFAHRFNQRKSMGSSLPSDTHTYLSVFLAGCLLPFF